MIPPDKVHINGTVYDGLTALEWRLMNALLGTEGIECQQVMEQVYGHDADDKDEALKQVAKRLNAKLAEKRCPCSVAFKSGFMVLEKWLGIESSEKCQQ